MPTVSIVVSAIVVAVFGGFSLLLVWANRNYR